MKTTPQTPVLPEQHEEEVALCIAGLSFSYPNGQPLFSELFFTQRKRDFTLLVGKTGSGKSTLLRLIKSELAPRGNRSGTIKIFGKENTHMSAFDSATQVGYVSQDTESQIVCETVLAELAFGCENLNLERDIIHRRIAEVVAFFGMESWLHAKTEDLSGGQKQILVLASILIMRPSLLLLDEPTSQLDPIAEKNFAHLLFRINRELGISVVLTTHKPDSLVAYATQVVGLEKGKIEYYRSERKRENTDPQRPTLLPSAHLADTGPVVVLKSVGFRYDNTERRVFQNLDFFVNQASIHALVGGNGSGKSTLLKIVAGILKPQRGKVKNAYLHEQAFLPQDPKALFVCDTVLEELREWKKSSGYEEEDIERELHEAGLSEKADVHPYDLSGGEQQMLALTKLILTKPKLLLLDEPTKGLDEQAKEHFALRLLDLRDCGISSIVASHNLLFISRVADTTSMIFDAEVTCTEPTQEFFEKNLFYRPQTENNTFFTCEEDSL